MAQATISPRIDSKDKSDLQTPDPFYSEANQAYVLKSVRELRSGKGQIHELIEMGDNE